jgi:hypothetical protein
MPPIIAARPMAAHQNIVGHHHVAADLAIMRHVDTRHQQAILAHDGVARSRHGAAMDRDVLAHLAARAQRAARRLTFVFEVLRRHADCAERIQHRVRTDHGMPVHDHMADQVGAILDRDIGAHLAPRPDGHAFADRSSACYDRPGMNSAQLPTCP